MIDNTATQVSQQESIEELINSVTNDGLAEVKCIRISIKVKLNYKFVQANGDDSWSIYADKVRNYWLKLIGTIQDTWFNKLWYKRLIGVILLIFLIFS